MTFLTFLLFTEKGLVVVMGVSGHVEEGRCTAHAQFLIGIRNAAFSQRAPRRDFVEQSQFCSVHCLLCYLHLALCEWESHCLLKYP